MDRLFIFLSLPLKPRCLFFLLFNFSSSFPFGTIFDDPLSIIKMMQPQVIIHNISHFLKCVICFLKVDKMVHKLRTFPKVFLHLFTSFRWPLLIRIVTKNHLFSLLIQVTTFLNKISLRLGDDFLAESQKSTPFNILIKA